MEIRKQTNKLGFKIKLDHSVPVENNAMISQWLVDCQQKSYKNKQKSLWGKLQHELELLFGKSTKSLRLEFHTKVWVLEYGDLIFNVFSAKCGGGTAIEICGFSHEEIHNGTQEKEIINFLTELHRLINP